MVKKESEMHERNKVLADKLRLLAETIEHSSDAYSASFDAYGGEPKAIPRGNTHVQVSFSLPGLAILIGDVQFVRSHTVVTI
jgi:hypothetical protein